MANLPPSHNGWFLRPCHIDGHQAAHDGWFHGFCTQAGVTYAMVELEGGCVAKLDMGLHALKFTDWEYDHMTYRWKHISSPSSSCQNASTC